VSFKSLTEGVFLYVAIVLTSLSVLSLHASVFVCYPLSVSVYGFLLEFND